MAYFIVIYAICGLYMVVNFKHDIHMLQQNSYRLPRYWRYLTKNDIGSAWRLCDVALLFIALSRLLDPRLILFIIALVALYKMVLISKKKFKKPLVFTKRVWRIYCVTAAIGIGLYLWTIFVDGFKETVFEFYSGSAITISELLLTCIFSWFIVMVGVVILMPVEYLINRRYWNDASRILKGMKDLKVIGITGSYGKTSTKHYLERILSEKFDVVMTPGSYNTPMGVIRTVREIMKPYNNVFICEMGAKQKGDVKEICSLVHPFAGIITAVGPMHLETFKSIENVQSTKFELVDALPKDGFAVVNDDFEYCANRKVENVECIRYTTDKNKFEIDDYHAENIKYSSTGTTFIVKGPEGLELPLSTKLIGDCNISNLLAAVIVALKLGMTEDEIKRGVASIEQVEHRLSVKHTAGGVTIIDDAFNSNPTGSKMALEVLSHFKEGKRIVVTPGMIELGSKQEELNEKFGEEIAKNCDVAIIVGHYNREAIVKGIHKEGFENGTLYEVENFNKAQEVLGEILKAGDTILYENDLPDSFK